MSISLYRKYRPQNFAGVAGQRAAIEIITNSIARDRVGHAYLFSGSRGCGKTSVARIFAKALNCLDRQGFEPCGQCSNCTAITAGESLDVIEIDGASNNGVDSIRELKENVALAPFTSKYKIYIIDEVHMLSQGAFNALLKTLEEPPEHVIFILATTEPQRVPVTIRSRCQHIPFHTISPEDIFKRVEEVCRLEDVKAEPEALWEIARQADGALRDALSLLEQIMASGEITLSNVEASFGAGSRPVFERWIKTLRTDPGEAYTSLKSMFDSGASGVRVFEEMFAIVRDLWLSSKWPKLAGTL
ncbi:MAG: DNA polymerase III subunit gamma/tau, partial [Synergistaceae bacterium]|nr:DNA polymerase III subunit gamma/tau [Synergistaceae bacterium]